ncbi:hypothetical protein AALP_AA3G055300 [Arabis alpina]|uniref:TRF2/HOY1 PH-like domain-containing protein n=1 Tax=Arabis alpina TaxID=50452 RepID=A0A087H784_ARAAL|nr:hypothetical protein AALP_AA3G055300 [Arabis alpina]
MNRSQQKTQTGFNRFVEEVTLPLLNLALTKSPEVISLFESTLKQEFPCTKTLQDFVKTLTPPETPKTHEKPKAMNFPISKITIGEWTRDARYPDDLKAKFYFAKKRLMWESLDEVDTGTRRSRLKRKIEIQWADVLSLRVTNNSHDGTEILEIELRKRPTFFMETNPQAGKHTQWIKMEQDFTLNQSASKYRRHTLNFAPGVLHKSMEKLVSSDNFWSERVKVRFPSLQNIFFDIGYEDINNNNNNINLPHHYHGPILSFNVNNVNHHLHQHSYGKSNFIGYVPIGEANDGKQMNPFVQDNSANQFIAPQVIQQPSPLINNSSDHLYNHPHGFPHMPIGESNFNISNQFYNDGMQNSFIQDNGVNQLLVPQIIQPSPQLINEPYSTGRYITGSQFNYPMIQDETQMRNTWELRKSQVYVPTLLDPQTNSMMFPHMNEPSTYPHQAGSYVPSFLDQEGETQNIEHTHHNGNFQTNNVYTDQFPNHGYDQYFGNNNGSLPPNLRFKY